MSAYVIGIDGGTESLRAGVFDLSGKPIAFAAHAYPTHFPKPSWAEQNPADWWDAAGKAVGQAVREAGIAPSAVTALSVDTTCCSVVALDARGDAVRPALQLEALGQAADGVLARRVRDPLRPRYVRRDRPVVDDPPALGFLPQHQRVRRLRAEERPRQVGVDHPPPVLLLHLLDAGSR